MISFKNQIENLIEVSSLLRYLEIRLTALEEKNKKLSQALVLIMEKGPASPGDKKHEIAKTALESNG